MEVQIASILSPLVLAAGLAGGAAMADLGIVSTVVWGCRSDLENGKLVKVLADWDTELVELHAVFPAGRAAKAAAHAFIVHLAQALAHHRGGRGVEATTGSSAFTHSPERPTKARGVAHRSQK
jgi:DNA-binding transcriptional LysR family regulator